jgi:mannose-6-phosphate isomerase-like protein (cupin superfamily)
MRMAATTDAGDLVPLATAGERATLLGFELRLVYRDPTGACALLELTLPPTTGRPPPHVHHRTEEALYVLEGVLTVQVGAQVVAAGAGTRVRIPTGTPHSFWNAGAAPARILSTVVPAGVERYLLELARQLAASDGTPEQAAAIRHRLGAQYDIAYVVR